MQKAVRQLHLYPDGNAFYFKQKLAEKLGVAPANLILGNGSNEIIEFVGHALIAPGVDVVVSQYLLRDLSACRKNVRRECHHRAGEKTRP